MYSIEVRESGGGMTVELWGEFDLFSLVDLRRALNSVLGLRRPTLLDLARVTFLDLESARELAVRAQLYAHQLTLRNPSLQVTASLKAFELDDWFRFRPGSDREEPPLVSETSS